MGVCSIASGLSLGLRIFKHLLFTIWFAGIDHLFLFLGSSDFSLLSGFPLSTPSKNKKNIMAYHDQSTTISCDKSGCKFFATSRFALNRHTAKQHPDKPPQSKTLKKCQRCDYLTDDSGSLKKHENICLKRDILYECKAEECEKGFGTETSLTLHFRRKHPKIIRKKSKFNQCQRCSYTTSHDIGRLRKHEKSCSKLDSSQFETCKHNYCGFKSSEKAIYHHIIKNHGLSCNYCPFETKAIEELRKHRRTHPRTLQPKKCTIGSCEFKGSSHWSKLRLITSFNLTHFL